VGVTRSASANFPKLVVPVADEKQAF